MLSLSVVRLLLSYIDHNSKVVANIYIDMIDCGNVHNHKHRFHTIYSNISSIPTLQFVIFAKWWFFQLTEASSASTSLAREALHH